MSNRWVIAGALFIVALMVAASVVATLKIDVSPTVEKARRPPRTQELAEGVKISQHGLYGVNLVTIGKAHMRKLRKGPFTIGAINELVLEDVTLALPEELWKGEEKVKGEGQGQERNGQPSNPQTSAKTMLGRLGINAGNLKMGGKMPRFSALQVRGLRVSRLVGTNAVPWFAAARGDAGRNGLELQGGFVIENGHTNAWKEALLVFEPSLMLLPNR